MSEKSLVRVWQELGLKEIESQLLIAGHVSGDCGNCREIGISFDSTNCPKCRNIFKYMATRLSDSPKEARRLKTKRPDLVLIDLKDFKDGAARRKAKGFLGE